MIVTPGLEVRSRILDSFLGKKDKEGKRSNPESADFNRALFMPNTPEWRGRFHLEIYEPDNVRANTTLTDGPFLFITNWHQFVVRKRAVSMWEDLTGEDVEDAPRGEVIMDQLTEFPDLIILNDEAHHVHGKKTAKGDELVWRKYVSDLHDKFKEVHGKKKGLFMQLDFSATPFFGSAEKKEYFPHIVYDYPLLSAMNEMLVKQLFLEERQALAGDAQRMELKVTSIREDNLPGKRGKVEKLSPDQLILLDIGIKKLEQLTQDFKNKAIEKKPVMMVLCEDTDTAELVRKHLFTVSCSSGELFNDKQVLMIHSELPDAELKTARLRLNDIDDNTNPLCIVLSVLMLREGFDKDNICVTVVLRSAKADLLLEQIVGRGLRQMFHQWENPEIWRAKVEAVQEIRSNRRPSNAFDFLFVVEHPQFKKFYTDLKSEGFNIAFGDSQQVATTGDVIPVWASPDRRQYDLAWPYQYYETGTIADFSRIDVMELKPYAQPFSVIKNYAKNLAVDETHAPSGKVTQTWRFPNKYFDFDYFLSMTATAVATEGSLQLFTGKKAEIAALIDEYVSTRLFKMKIDFSDPDNYSVLNFTLVHNHIVEEVRNAVKKLLGQIVFKASGNWKLLSDFGRINVRETTAVTAAKCLYPLLPTAYRGGGFEKNFIEKVLEPSVDVQAYCKMIENTHKFTIRYRNVGGIEKNYYPDFIVKCSDKMYVLETKGDINAENVGLKAASARAWCEQASTIDPPEGISQPREWEYLIVPQELFDSYSDRPWGSLDSILDRCRAYTEKIISQELGLLFV